MQGVVIQLLTITHYLKTNKQNSYNLKIIFSPYDEPQKTGDECINGKGGVDIVGDNITYLTRMNNQLCHI